ncbi:MAG: ABC transporter ATP-binding protein [Muribaculaceae bacterium]|nr:ABC transporter ATP-binding protein [Muribaculaceae bacterium]
MSLLSFQKVSFAYPKGEEILKDISFDIGENERVALLGLNGAGKSTLMLHTNGLLIPQKGRVMVENFSTDSKKEIKEIRKIVGMVFQNPDDQLFMPEVWDDVAFGPRNMNLDEEEIERRVAKAMLMTRTLELAHKSPFELSGGQKKSVSIATVLSMSPRILIMDEPTSGLDYEATRNFIELIESLFGLEAKNGGNRIDNDKVPAEELRSLLLSTHDMVLARRLCTRALIIKEGRLIYDGPLVSAPYPD